MNNTCSNNKYRNYRTRISRADLLDCIANSPETWQTQAKQLGFVQVQVQVQVDQSKRQPIQKDKSNQQHNQVSAAKTNTSKNTKQQGLKAKFYCVESYNGRSNHELESTEKLVASAPKWFKSSKAYDPKKIQSDITLSAPKPLAIVSNARLLPRLKTQLNRQKSTVKINIPRFMDNQSRGKWFVNIPYKQRNMWTNKLIIVIEESSVLWPFKQDIKQLCADLIARRGVCHVEVRQIKCSYPDHHYTNKTAKKPKLHRWNYTDTQSRVLIISDLGCIDLSRWKWWEKWGETFKQAGRKPTVLLPCAMPDSHRKLKLLFSISYWSQKVHHVERYNEEATNKIIEKLLILLAPASRIEPALVRDVCKSKLLGSIPSTDIEARLWCHGAVFSYPSAIVFKLPQANAYREKFAQLDIAIQKQILHLLHKHHRHLHPAVLHEDNTAWHKLVASNANQEMLQKSQEFLQQTAVSLKNANYTAIMRGWVDGVYQRIGKTVLSQSAELKIMWGIFHQDELKTNASLKLPDGVEYSDIQWIIDHVQQMRDYVLYQQGRDLLIATKQHFDAINISANNDKMFVKSPFTYSILQFSSRMQVLQLAPLNILRALPRDEQQIVLPARITKKVFTLTIDQQSWKITNHQRYSWASNAGFDQWGFFAEFTIDNVTQRLRWIPAGHFLMGSPESEAERLESEKQHAVILTQGYWLADTACTQALWLAVMGNNPSHFQSDRGNPVERVSWGNAQIFIKRLNQKMPELRLALPTEAQWEYACRAGTSYPFNLGENISVYQVNYYDEDYYSVREKEKKDGKTVPVKSKQVPNGWGLHEMHGNVWEWCQDWRGEYFNGEVVDPSGVTNGTVRVLRGGSWVSRGKANRSANRFANQPSSSSNCIGFRLSGKPVV